jgi:uncharacterized BrkB/YihY/UPF0761 family membrane protein
MSARPDDQPDRQAEHRSRTGAVRDGIAVVRGEIARAPERLEELRGRTPTVDAAMDTFEYDRRRVGGLLAGALAFRLFLWLLPIGLLLIAVAGFAAASRSTDDLGDGLGLTGYVTGVIADTGSEAKDGRWLTALVALVAVYSTSSSAGRAIRAIHLLAWGMEPRRPKRKWAVALGFTGLTLLALSVNAAAVAARREDPGLGLSLTLLAVVAFFLLWMVISYLLPHGDVGWRELVPGALLVAVGAQAMHLVVVYYLARKLERSSELYGSLGTASAMLLGLYMVGRLLVAAPMLNATLDRRRRERDASAQGHDVIDRGAITRTG